MILLKSVKTYINYRLDADLKIILLDRQNNYAKISSMINNVKSFDLLATGFERLTYTRVIILIVQQNFRI